MVSYKALNTILESIPFNTCNRRGNAYGGERAANLKRTITNAGNAVRNDNIKQRTQPLNADSANMANQLILLRTKQKDAEVIMQTLFSSKAP